MTSSDFADVFSGVSRAPLGCWRCGAAFDRPDRAEAECRRLMRLVQRHEETLRRLLDHTMTPREARERHAEVFGDG